MVFPDISYNVSVSYDVSDERRGYTVGGAVAPERGVDVVYTVLSDVLLFLFIGQNTLGGWGKKYSSPGSVHRPIVTSQFGLRWYLTPNSKGRI